MYWRTPITIESVPLKNRIFFPPISTNWADKQGSVTEKIVSFYGEIASGGCAFVVVGGTAVSPEGKGTDRSMVLHKDSQLHNYSKLSEIIQNNSCVAAIQLMHVGGQGNPSFTGYRPSSPSGVYCETTSTIPMRLSIKDIKNIRKSFVSSAILAHRAGFQAVELHMAHGYLLHEFLSDYSNRRNDIYGGSKEKRIKFPLEVISEIREHCPDLLIGARISAEDYLDCGINLDKNRYYLPQFETVGVNYFSVTAGIYKTSSKKHQAMATGKFFEYAHSLKAFLKKPVFTAGKVLGLDQAENYLAHKCCDVVGMGRALIADPDLIKATENGQVINRCSECGICMYLRHGLREMTCPVRGI